MSRKRKPLPPLKNILIADVAIEGKSLARVNDTVVSILFTVSGDVVDLQVHKKKHHYCEAEVVRFIKYNDMRQALKYQHFGACGGREWRILPYEEQLKTKQK